MVFKVCKQTLSLDKGCTTDTWIQEKVSIQMRANDAMFGEEIICSFYMNTWVFSLILNRKVCYMYKTCIYEFFSTYNDAFHVLINCKAWILSNEHPSFFNFVWICSYLMCLWTWKYTWWKICKLLVNFELDNTINF